MYIPNKHIVFGLIDLFLLGYGIGSVISQDYKMAILWTILLILITILWVFFHNKDRKCPQCEKYGAMENTKKEIIERTPTTTGQYDRPATLYTFHIHRKCKYCGYEDFFEYNNTRTHKCF